MKDKDRRIIAGLSFTAAALCLTIALELAAESPAAATLPDGGKGVLIAGSQAFPADRSEAVADDFLQDIKARPLFEPDRRPVAVVGTTVHGLPRLSGTVVTPDTKVAIFQDQGQPKAILVRPGDHLGDWTVEHIDSQTVTVQKAGETVLLKLRYSDDSEDNKRLPPR